MAFPSIVFWCIVITLTEFADATCERSPRLIGAEDVCWTNKVKVIDRLQYTTHSVLNFAKEKLGLEPDERFQPQQCDYYECVFRELKMLKPDGYPSNSSMIEWIDNNLIYKQAKMQYDRLQECEASLKFCLEKQIYFSGTLMTVEGDFESSELQSKCEVLKEYMRCLSLVELDCVIFKYP